MPVNLDYAFFPILSEGQQHQSPPAVQLAAPPLSLVNNLSVQKQLSETRGPLGLIEATDVLQSAYIGQLGELVLDAFPAEDVLTSCTNMLQQLCDSPHWFLEIHCCFLHPRPELAGGDARTGTPFLLHVLQLRLHDGHLVSLADILLVVLVVDSAHAFDPVDGVIAPFLLYWLLGGLHALIVVVFQELQRVLVVVYLAAFSYEALLTACVGGARGGFAQLALFDQLGPQ